MLDSKTKRRIDDARDILVGKIPDPKSQVEQITIALIYKFMDDMDVESEEFGGEAKFFVGEYKKYSWRRVFNKTRGGQEILLDYREALQKLSENPELPSIFHTIFRQAYLPYNDPETLKEFLKIIDKFSYDHSEELGDAFEYLLSVLGSQGDAGQFRTPRHIIDFMVEIVQPKKNETILDPACGTAGFLISAYKHILRSNSSDDKDRGDKLTPDERKALSSNINGYDISPDMVRLSLVNMYLHSITEPKITEYDTLTSDAKWNEYFDVIFANPPFMSPKGGIKPHSRFSVQSKRTEALFVDYIAEHLTTVGRGAVIVPEGVIFKSDTAFTKLRKMLIDDHYLYGVVSLPAGVFNPYSGVKTSILLFDKPLARLTDKILFAKINNEGFDLGAQRRPNDRSEIPAILSEILNFKTKLFRKQEFTPTLCTLVEKSKISESGDYNLSGERYLDSVEYNSKYGFTSLSDVCEFHRGVVYSKSDEVETDGIKILRANNIDITNTLNLLDIKQISKLVSVSNAQRLIKGDILMCVASGSSNHIGKIAYIEDNTDLYFGGFMGVLRCKYKVISKYLYYQLIGYKFNKYLNNVISGANIKNINKRILYEYEIPLPSIEKQEAIVAEIEGYQKIIDASRTIVDNYRPQITIDPEWPMVQIGKLVDDSLIGLIKSKAEQDYSNLYKYLKMDSIDYKGNLDLSKFSRVNATAEEISKYTLNDDDFVYNTRNAPNLVGKSAVYHGDNGEFLFNNNLLRIRFNKELANSDYINYVMNSEYGKMQLHKYIDGTTSVAAIYQKNYFSIKIPLPDLATQEKIVSEIEKEQQAVNSAKQLIKIFEQKISDRIAKVWGE